MMTLALGLFALVPATSSQDGGIWDRLKLYANGRLRGEATLDNVDGAGNAVDDRFRGRMRARLGATYQLAEDVKLEARISTSSDGNDANNPHWDFGDGDGFNGSGVVMDRFSLDWAASDDLHVVAGKQAHVFASPPIFGDFVWDSDVSPSGVTAKWKPMTDDDVSFDARAAAYIATEVSADDDATMLGLQGNVYVPVDEGKLQLSTSFYDWNNTDVVAGNQGNTTTGGAIDADFLVWEGFASATIPGGPLNEMTGYLQFMNNLDESSEDFGWVIGAQLGPSKWKKGDYNVFLLFYSLDANAIFSPVAQDDTAVAGTGIGGGTDGLILGGQYFWRDNVAVKLWVLTSNPDGADDDPMRIRLDLDFNII